MAHHRHERDPHQQQRLVLHQRRLATTTTCGEGALPENFCTLTEAAGKVPAATIISVGIGKGRDDAFQGAVDWLKLNYNDL